MYKFGQKMLNLLNELHKYVLVYHKTVKLL